MSTLLLLLSLMLPAMAKKQAPLPPALLLAESEPIETTLDLPQVPQAADQWLDIVSHARKSLEIAQFYVSPGPADGSRGPDLLLPVLDAVRAAAKRGVVVRIVADAKFHEKYPQTLDELGKVKGVEVRLLDLEERTGGVLHAKYLLADGTDGWLGSQNFDWRSLSHIQELGVRLREPTLVGALSSVFEQDWALAGGTEAPPVKGLAARFPVTVPYPSADSAETVSVRFVASPRSLLPDPDLWDLPRIVELIDGASETVHVQLLSYELVGYDKTYWDELDSALRRAAARGVKVQMMVADWSKRGSRLEPLRSLAVLRGVEVRFIVIPEWTTAHVPFARVAHAKYLVVDGQRSWVGTGNWSRDYFEGSRNVGIIVDGAPFAADLETFFDHTWGSTYTEKVDGCSEYTAREAK